MIYAFLKVWTNWVIRLFFRKIYTSGIETVPKKKALLVASNHPNGFIEPITMACLFPRPLHFLVRGDVFENKFARFWLEKTNQIPIFRFKDGFENLRKNNQSIEIALKKLQQGETILIFVEGGTEATKRVRPLQKGLARIAFQVLDLDPNLDLDILTVGLNYFDNRKFRSESILSVGRILSANEYHAQYKVDLNRGIKLLNEEIYAGIKDQVIHLDDIKDTNLLNRLLTLTKVVKNNTALPLISKDGTVLKRDKFVAEILNNSDDYTKKSLAMRSDQIVKKYGLDTLINQYHNNSPLLINLLLVILLSPLALAGIVINAIPFFGGKILADTTAKKSIFYMSLWLSGMAVFALLFYLIAAVVACFLIGWKGLFILLGIPLLSISMIWRDRYKTLISQSRLGRLSNQALNEIKAFFQEIGVEV